MTKQTQEPMTAEQLAEKPELTPERVAELICKGHARELGVSEDVNYCPVDDYDATCLIKSLINQAREADKRKIEDLEACLRNTQGIFNESLKVNINRSTQIEELESKVLELTEAATEVSNWLICGSSGIAPPDDMAQSFQHMQEVLDKALSTTPDTAILERIKAEGFNEGVEAAIKKFENYPCSTVAEDDFCAAMELVQSIKKEGK